MTLLQRQRASTLLPDAVSEAQRSAADARARLQAAQHDDTEVNRMARELRELQQYDRLKVTLLNALGKVSS